MPIIFMGIIIALSLDAHFLKEENALCVIQISVSDTGIGINAEQQKRLFSFFQQIENGKVE